VSIQAVSPLEIWSASTRNGAVALMPSAWVCAISGATNADIAAAEMKLGALMTGILANGKP
jgi:hypothetical protein